MAATILEGNLIVKTATDYIGFGVNATADGSLGVRIVTGTGTPNAVVTAPQGSIFLRTDGAADTILYVNTNGITAWTALTST